MIEQQTLEDLHGLFENPQKALYGLTGETFDEQQLAYAEDVWAGFDVTIKKPHGVGGTWSSARLDYLMWLRIPGSTVVITAPTERQVNLVLDEIRIIHEKAASRLPALRTINVLGKNDRFMTMPGELWRKWRIVAVVPKEAGKMEGYHADSWIIYHADECKELKDGLFAAMDGGCTQGGQKMYTSVPGIESGGFYKACEEEPKADKGSSPKPGHWRVHQLKATKSRFVSPDWIEYMLRKWGKESPVVRQKVYAEFASFGDKNLIPYSYLKAAKDREHFPDNDKPWRWGFDPASVGTDLAVLCLGQGRNITRYWVNAGKTLPAAVGRWAMNCLGDSHRTSRGNVDATGDMGAYEAIKDKRWNVNGVKFGSRAISNEQFENIKAEGYWSLREAFLAGEISLPSEDQYIDDVMSELASMKVDQRPNGRLYIIDPNKSPDFADATMLQHLQGTIARPVVMPEYDGVKPIVQVAGRGNW